LAKHGSNFSSTWGIWFNFFFFFFPLDNLAKEEDV